ncbi:aspartokinase 2 [Kurthia zopfii]|uniref:Aspartokinase n=1 Tax=Kurthia zopfii TaxID=1650 RepID=A0A8B4QC04_9BACL|nr:aspartate kinase [Kurthia zopfii]PWI23038.1 aspartate kinase [Kurthia zopfii]TDR40498.1 aspartate kinase [Kurthia zopfii]GEK30057.1 aspartokinase 2 [Kurthia zopfii]STX10237.1 Aspartokinase 2 [Kurthia zopfii]
MGTYVMKFGGTSVATPALIQNVAKRVLCETECGNKVVVVVSAMGKTTDQLVSMAKELSEAPSKREMDVLLSTGEQVTIALLTMALQQLKINAMSFTGWQAGMVTEDIPSNARIETVDTEALKKCLAEGKVAVVAGFQGVDRHGNITTLGRGGSDTTAVAIAAALEAERCDIYTDVEGFFTSDPRHVKNARKLDEISFDEMLELAHLGAGVIHPRAVELAKNYQMPMSIRSSTIYTEGSILKEEVQMEKDLVVRGVAFEGEIVRLTVYFGETYNSALANIFTTLAKHHINVDIIVQSVIPNAAPTVSFSVKKEQLKEALQVLADHQEVLGYDHIDHELDLAKVSIVGSGMASNPGVAAEMFDCLFRSGIPVKMVSTSEIKVSVVVPEEEMFLAANALHDQFELGVMSEKLAQ